MTRNIKDLIAKMPQDRQDAIKKRSEEISEELKNYIKNNPHLPDDE